MPARLPLDAVAARAIGQRIAAVEARTGVQVVCAVHLRSDSYPEVPWHAFALGVVIAALLATLLDFFRPAWSARETLLVHSLVLLGAGAACAAATLAFDAFARLFIARGRCAAEVRERARSIFVDHALHSTRARTGVLMYVSLFERGLEVVADRGFDERIRTDGWDGIVHAMRPGLAQGDCQRALEDGLATLERALVAAGFRSDGSASNDLPDALVQARGGT